ncbi:diguanylate cyclase [Reinekea sp.]|jgi:diguanylate cyclase (GGDEF)-like protein|uniref:diguanylate cyclase n=1 Tax=Reinekea sp. TaxID=1970455 RepID=UPI0039893560
MSTLVGSTRSDVKIKKNRIRLYFYIGTVVPVFVFMFVYSLTITNSIKKQHIASIDQLSESILIEKKLFIKNSVEQAIYIIDNIYLGKDDETEAKFQLSSDEKTAFENKVRRYLYGLKFIDKDQYIWINSIIDFNGGDDYAQRLIHPNLPETEGGLLSTNTIDFQGNKPYEVELAGIREQGELFNSYYFKKMGSNEVSNKLSYAKLYEPLNWVVATGIYLDDLENYIELERQKLNEVYDSQKLTSTILVAMTMLFTAILIYLFERNISRLVYSYEKEISGYSRELEKLSTTDKLTGLSNRLFLDGILEKVLEKSKRYKTPFSIILIDIDHFKNVNDTFGHQAGDTLLKEFSALLKSNTRSSDAVGRWGGEEFLIICMESGQQGAVQLAETLRGKIATFDFSIVSGASASFGVSSFLEEDTPERIIERADKALYQAKRQGRNRVVVSASGLS